MKHLYGKITTSSQVQSTTISNIMIALHETESVDIDVSNTLNQSGLVLEHIAGRLDETLNLRF